ncbi:GFA family protein [Pseudomonas sp. R2.Fl]|nr:GFA family protein [Pseudomonas sp. R2.Fl]
MVELKARCLCGDVRIVCDGEILSSGHCHCESCRRTTSAAVASFFVMRKEDVAISGGSLRSFESSPGVRRSFCGRCGSPVAYEGFKRPDQIDLYVASLEEGYAVEVKEHWFWGERVSWLHVEDDLPKSED